MTPPPAFLEGDCTDVQPASPERRRRRWEVAGGVALGVAFALAVLVALGVAYRDAGLFRAVSQGDLRRTELFLAIGADPNQPEPVGGSLLLNALQAEQDRIAMVLLRHGADPNAKRSSGVTPLMSVRDPGVVRELLTRGADPHARDGDGNTPLVWATVYGEAEVSALLLDAGAEANVRGAQGITPLILAASDGNEALVKLLLEHGADPSQTTRTGYTALTAAKENGNPAVIRLLRAALSR